MVAHLSSRSVPRPPIKRGWARFTTPYALVLAVLVVLGAIVGAVGLAVSDPQTSTVSCAMSDEAMAAGLKEQDARSLDGVDPSILADANVKVLNANGQTGQAGQVASELGEMGFATSGNDSVGNDPLYPNQDLTCHGQIRYGADGKAQAAALQLAAPCMQLVTDGRSGTNVDLALGSYFQELSTDAQQTLAALAHGQQVAKGSMEIPSATSC